LWGDTCGEQWMLPRIQEAALYALGGDSVSIPLVLFVAFLVWGEYLSTGARPPAGLG
jgi:hypothetical protein